RFYSSPVIKDSKITANEAFQGGGLGMGHEQGPTVTNCVVDGNYAWHQGGGIYMSDGNQATINNCTITGNIAYHDGGGIYPGNGYPLISNSILWDNTPDEIFPGYVYIRFCDVEKGWSPSGEQRIIIDPNFAEAGYWDPNGTPDNTDDDLWVAGDYHLRSTVGRWDPNMQSWRQDAWQSPCIDAGAPIGYSEYPPVYTDWSRELWPYGGRINMGAYGGTAEASMSLSSVGNVADLNGDGVVDFLDWGMLGKKWMREEVLLQADLDRDGVVNIKDLYLFVGEWLWKK
ncbi:MAG: hypothetical protein GY869_18950, partial [Planctomycetes bacterium]|nr:hypothetical protein [Planctomycetota bacterium]